MYQDPKDVPMPEPYDYCYEWDGPYGTRKFSTAPHNGRGPDRTVPLYIGTQLTAYAEARCAALSARVAELEADALKLRGQYGVALDLLTECVYPMKVCAAVVENEVDDDGLERLIEQVREFVAHARGLKKGDTPSTEGEQG